jgi:glycogen debranching enzyme
LVDTDPLLADPFVQALDDLNCLAMHNDDDPPFVAAGAPWFLALFGRDTLVTSLMAPLIGSWHARGALSSLGKLQAVVRDDFRDAEPGKIPHELRHGELAHFGIVPHAPYYGTHDAPPLYALALWNAFRWTGDRALLDRHLPTAKAAIRWCETDGDRDRDGLLEYMSRSSSGYGNQGWKDAGDAIPHENGRLAEPPIATVELQGYLFAAFLAMSELLSATGEKEESERMRKSALALQKLVEQRFWMEDAGCYGLALDRDKRLVRSISSNPGHVLWCGLPSIDRARRVAARFFQPDMFSGYGVRTLSADHSCFNPLSYQLGSVWPHDNALFAAGLMRYGLRDEAAKVLRAILEAADDFEQNRLPELFCGFSRSEGAPVPYEKANVPQAWAAAVPILAVQLFIGLIPDVPNGRCFISPWLPDWLAKLEVKQVRVGDGDLDISLRRSGSQTRIERAHHPTLEIVNQLPTAALWGRPP